MNQHIAKTKSVFAKSCGTWSKLEEKKKLWRLYNHERGQKHKKKT